MVFLLMILLRILILSEVITYTNIISKTHKSKLTTEVTLYNGSRTSGVHIRPATLACVASIYIMLMTMQ